MVDYYLSHNLRVMRLMVYKKMDITDRQTRETNFTTIGPCTVKQSCDWSLTLHIGYRQLNYNKENSFITHQGTLFSQVNVLLRRGEAYLFS